jgi:hypothetical protein
MTSTYIERSIAVRVVASGYIPLGCIYKISGPCLYVDGSTVKGKRGGKRERERGRDR